MDLEVIPGSTQEWGNETEGKEATEGYTVEKVTTVGRWSSVPFRNSGRP